MPHASSAWRLWTSHRRGNTNMRKHREAGFSLIELMIVVVVIGILAAIAIPNFVAMQDRAKEAGVKSNGHTLQLSAEDYGVQNDGVYAGTAAEAAATLPGQPAGANFKNPFDKSVGTGNAWTDQATWTVPLASGSTKRGIVAYGDSAGQKYQIALRGKNSDLSLVLSSGQ